MGDENRHKESDLPGLKPATLRVQKPMTLQHELARRALTFRVQKPMTLQHAPARRALTKSLRAGTYDMVQLVEKNLGLFKQLALVESHLAG